MVTTRNTSRGNANPPRMQDPSGDADSRPPGAVEVMQVNTNEVEALRLINQRLVEELEQLTRQMQHPRETRQTQDGHNIPSHEGRHNHGIPRGAEAEAESSQARGHEPRLAPAEEENEAEYEAVIAGLNLAHSLEVDQLEVYSDSQLVVRQIEDTYEAKSERMILYLQKVRNLLKKFVLVLKDPDPD